MPIRFHTDLINGDVEISQGCRRSISRTGYRWQRGISLIEMMIAIVILGLGLIMVATIFPVAWTRARQLVESTKQNSCTAIAEATVRSLLKVDGRLTEVAMLPSDQIAIFPDTDQNGNRFFTYPVPGDQTLRPDSRVHALNLGNIQYEARAFVADDSWMLDPLDQARKEDYESNIFTDQQFQDYFDSNGQLFFPLFFKPDDKIAAKLHVVYPQVAFAERIYPPMRVRSSTDFSDDDARWDATLATRRYTWSVFYKLSDEYVNRVASVPPGSLIDETRTLSVYYVTLRRSNPTQRFARQDPKRVADPTTGRATAVKIRALKSDTDLMFPIPWRVQVLLPDGHLNPPFGAGEIRPAAQHLGIPTQILLNPKDPNGKDQVDARIDDNDFVVDMFKKGVSFIDERNGQVYRVEKRRLIGDDQDEAVLTLDREIVLEDVVDDATELSPSDRLRAVWVFPPPVKGNRNKGDALSFTGQDPLVGIEVRTLDVSP